VSECPFVTLRLTTKHPNGRRGKDMFVSGTVKAVTDRTVTLEVEHHATGPWDRDSVRTVTIQRSRIRYQSRPFPTM